MASLLRRRDRAIRLHARFKTQYEFHKAEADNYSDALAEWGAVVDAINKEIRGTQPCE